MQRGEIAAKSRLSLCKYKLIAGVAGGLAGILMWTLFLCACCELYLFTGGGGVLAI